MTAYRCARCKSLHCEQCKEDTAQSGAAWLLVVSSLIPGKAGRFLSNVSRLALGLPDREEIAAEKRYWEERAQLQQEIEGLSNADPRLRVLRRKLWEDYPPIRRMKHLDL
jgi:hypothetical protein